MAAQLPPEALPWRSSLCSGWQPPVHLQRGRSWTRGDEIIKPEGEPAMDLAELIVGKRDQILAAADRHGAHDVRVFGSVARGDYDEDSDIDLLVDLELGRSLLDAS